MREGEPAGPVLLYDGDCGFCSRSVRFLEEHNLMGYRATPWQRVPDGELTVAFERLQSEVVLVRPGLPVVGGADALAASVRASDSRLRFTGRLLALPGFRAVAHAVYRQVARNRYRLPGGSAACRIG
ncbi:hypothetical protein CFN78_13400 [Amycolatopsis antarctica]|uniref:Thiol-disulfide oxidoreductase n=1 Tax=Amycolatopsis antarctica TaxID=1854586 RepID=A0A263D345_9PSEU|nr:DUF393 domain-containing protein [Amycolatopsis antarctica]OZM72629.1 hypothetical protein CFN78_13400 [Amycolatopsis antarctica]